jgi:hypothetical protein
MFTQVRKLLTPRIWNGIGRSNGTVKTELSTDSGC